jgi:epoxyqueuosine reductase
MLSLQLSDHIKNKALAEGALLVGITKIRKVEPVIVFGFPFTDDWFFKKPLAVAGLLGEASIVSSHVLNICSHLLKAEGYTAHIKSIWSVYGDFRPLAVAAGLGEWGRNGIVTHKDYGAGLLFAAIFTNAPLHKTATRSAKQAKKHCNGCKQCIKVCPYNAFDHSGFHLSRCIKGALQGCAACVKVCSRH